jgi:nanoRNase/pAp phosphatase (c-di-AMP/oligoRNAs hydrolase)
MDVAAFSFLYPLANLSTLRRIDRPQIPRSDLRAVGNALAQADIHDNVLFAHMGPLTREDVVPYSADLCLDVEDVEWSVASGVYEGQLIASIRYFGGDRNAGEVVKHAFESFGSAGGHRAMAKAVIPLKNLPADCTNPGEWIQRRFRETLAVRAVHAAE